MKHLRHHYPWQLRRFRQALVLYALLWVSAMVLTWLPPQWFKPEIVLPLHLWLPLMGAVILARALMEDGVPGTASHWRTRPPRWPAVWCSQWLFLLTVAAPPLACWLLNGLLLDNTVAQWRGALWDTAIILCPLVAVAGVASLSRGWYSLAVATAAFTGCWLLGYFALSRFGAPMRLPLQPGAVRGTVMLLFIGPALVGLTIWLAGMKSGRLLRRSILFGGLLIAGPALISYWLLPRDQMPPDRRVLTVEQAGGEMLPGELRMGALKISGVPAGRFAFVQEDSLALQEDSVLADSPSGQLFQTLRASQSTIPLWPAMPPNRYPLDALASLFPKETQWYYPDPSPRSPGRMLPRTSSVVLHLVGSARGWIIQPEILIAAPLEEGTVSSRGARLSIHHLRVEPMSLMLEASLRQCVALTEIQRPDGGSIKSGENPFLPVLHLPAVSCAVVLSSESSLDQTITWQTHEKLLSIRATVPLAESIRGRRWDEKTLRGARLVLCRMNPVEEFIATPVAAPLKIPGPDAADDLMRALETLPEKKQTPLDESALSLLQAASEPTLRALIARDQFESRFAWLSGPVAVAVSPAFLEELALRDDRWITAALNAGLKERAGPVALKLLRERPARLPLDALAAAAALARPDDYPALRRQITMSKTGTGAGWTGTVLWKTLRTLPGFDWKAAATSEWARLRAAVHYQVLLRDGLTLSAALAGNSAALRSLCEQPNPRTTFYQQATITEDEWNELHALIEGLPADLAARSAWLHEHRGSLTWDAAASRYRLPPP